LTGSGADDSLDIDGGREKLRFEIVCTPSLSGVRVSVLKEHTRWFFSSRQSGVAEAAPRL